MGRTQDFDDSVAKQMNRIINRRRGRRLSRERFKNIKFLEKKFLVNKFI